MRAKLDHFRRFVAEVIVVSSSRIPCLAVLSAMTIPNSGLALLRFSMNGELGGCQVTQRQVDLIVIAHFVQETIQLAADGIEVLAVAQRNASSFFLIILFDRTAYTFSPGQPSWDMLILVP